MDTKLSNSGTELQAELRKRTEPLYQELIDKFGDELVPFKALIGRKYPKEKHSGIVFYGRCTNGWKEYNKDGSYTELKDFFTTTSPFLNLMYYEYCSYYREEEWMDYAVFNNVVKMVPESEGNCTDKQWDDQYHIMKEIIRIENEVLSPKLTILVVGNYGWESPFKELGFLDNPVKSKTWGTNSKGGESTLYKYGEQYFIITDRPEGRKIEDHSYALWELMKDAK